MRPWAKLEVGVDPKEWIEAISSGQAGELARLRKLMFRGTVGVGQLARRYVVVHEWVVEGVPYSWGSTRAEVTNAWS